MTLRFLPVLLIVPFLACSSKKAIDRGPDPLETVQGFCQSWAEAACNDTVLQYCTTTADDCQDSQSEFCESLFDDGDYNRSGAEDCLKAVENAYSEGDLVASELKTVRNLENGCFGVINGMGDEGDDCEQDSDCNAEDDLSCVMRADGGTCQEAEEVAGGYECDDPAIVCADGFYCDGENCIRQKANAAPCAWSGECREGMYCLFDEDSSSGAGGEGGAGNAPRQGLCVNKRALSDACESNEQCEEGTMCLLVGDDPGECVAIARLGQGHPICEEELS